MKKSYLFVLFFGMLFMNSAYAQLPVSLELPRTSPKETRSLTIGFTKIAFEYSSVATRDREIWGALVPYGRVWRTGANENTLFSVTDDVRINGQLLKAGTYAMHTIPNEEEWTIIFSNFTGAWGSFFYDEAEDALRVTVTPEKMDSKYEWMKFSFADYTSTSAEISLKWAGLKIPFMVEVAEETTFAHIENQLRTLPAFRWYGWFQGAEYCLDNDVHHDKGLVWSEQALQRGKNAQTMYVRSVYLAKNGQISEALSLSEENLESNPDNWMSHYGHGWALLEANNAKGAETALKKALELAPGFFKGKVQAKLDAIN